MSTRYRRAKKHKDKLAKAKLGLKVAAVFGLVGLGLAIYRVNYLSKAKRTQATVVKMHYHASSRTEAVAPEYFFVSESREEVRVRSTMYTRKFCEVGDVFDVFYLPDDPENMIVDRFSSKWGLAVLSGGIGGVIFLRSMVLRAKCLNKLKAMEYRGSLS